MERKETPDELVARATERLAARKATEGRRPLVGQEKPKDLQPPVEPKPQPLTMYVKPDGLKVLLQFDRGVSVVLMSPEDAMALANKLAEVARQVRGQMTQHPTT